MAVESLTSSTPWTPLDVVTDATGRYEATGFPAGAYIRVRPARDERFRSPCPPGITEPLQSDRVVNINVVSADVLSTTGLPASFPRNWPGVTGTVVESTSGGARAAAGTLVDLFYAQIDPSDFVSSTVTDASGRYAMCVPPPGGNDQLFWVRATKPGSGTDERSVVITIDVSVDLTLQR
jgi:hypothetical protein